MITKVTKNKDFDIDNIASMSYQELFPEIWKKMMDEKYKREKLLYEEKQEAMTDHLNVLVVKVVNALTMNFKPVVRMRQ